MDDSKNIFIENVNKTKKCIEKQAENIKLEVDQHAKRLLEEVALMEKRILRESGKRNWMIKL